MGRAFWGASGRRGPGAPSARTRRTWPAPREGRRAGQFADAGKFIPQGENRGIVVSLLMASADRHSNTSTSVPSLPRMTHAPLSVTSRSAARTRRCFATTLIERLRLSRFRLVGNDHETAHFFLPLRRDRRVRASPRRRAGGTRPHSNAEPLAEPRHRDVGDDEIQRHEPRGRRNHEDAATPPARNTAPTP